MKLILSTVQDIVCGPKTPNMHFMASSSRNGGDLLENVNLEKAVGVRKAFFFYGEKGIMTN